MRAYGTAREDSDVLKRIVALLLGLAWLAELACRRSRPVCLLALRFLRPAERVAREFVMGEIHPAFAVKLLASMPEAADCDSRVEAVRLSLCFRILAAATETLVGPANPGCTGVDDRRAASRLTLSPARRAGRARERVGRRRPAGRSRDRPENLIAARSGSVDRVLSSSHSSRTGDALPWPWTHTKSNG
jgi:hypothetical protein